MAELLQAQAHPQDLIVHEGPLENSAGLVLYLGRAVKVVDGRQSSLAFGATFREGRDVFWHSAELKARWGGRQRLFLLSGMKPEGSVVRGLDPKSVHLLLKSGGRWLYSNRP